MTKRVFGELELAILKIFQRHEKDQKRFTVRDILSALGAHDKYTTIMTVMNRLVEKKLLERVRSGQQYEYWFNTACQSESLSLFDKLKQRIFGGNSASMASYLIESSDVTDAELLEMENLIREIRHTRRHS